MITFLLLFCRFWLENRVKNSYAPQVSLLGIFQQTRDHRTCIAIVKNNLSVLEIALFVSKVLTLTITNLKVLNR
jgi:hypothetical protein